MQTLGSTLTYMWSSGEDVKTDEIWYNKQVEQEIETYNIMTYWIDDLEPLVQNTKSKWMMVDPL